jgi:hypothetical protein
MEVDIAYLQRHELAPTSQRFVRNTQHDALSISSRAFAGRRDPRPRNACQSQIQRPVGVKPPHGAAPSGLQGAANTHSWIG